MNELILEKNNSLPKGWMRTILENIITKISNGTTEKQSKDKTNYPVSRIENNIKQILMMNKYIYNQILFFAFKGKLVPQDPNDESAEILLKKIKQEREQGKKQKIIKVKSQKSRRKNVK